MTLCVRYRQHRHICIPVIRYLGCGKYVTMLLQCCHCYHLGNVMFSYESISNSHPLPLSGIIPMCNNLETMCRCTQYCMHVHELYQCRYTHCLVCLHAIGEQNVNTIVPPLFTFCSSTLEQTVNRNKARTRVTPPWGYVLLYVQYVHSGGDIQISTMFTIDTLSKV